jgi:hypothetical protein
MTGPGATSSKSVQKNLAPSSEVSDAEYSPGLKEVLIEPEGVYKHTRTRKGVIISVDYKRLTSGVELDDEHSVIADSQTSSSSVNKEVFAYMAGSPEEIAKRFEDQAQL